MRKFFLSVILHFVIQLKVLRYIVTNFDDDLNVSRLILITISIMVGLISTVIILQGAVDLITVLRLSAVALLWLYIAAIFERVTNKEKPWNY